MRMSQFGFKTWVSSVAAVALLVTAPIAVPVAAQSSSGRALTAAETVRMDQANAELKQALQTRDWKAAAAALQVTLEISRAVSGPTSNDTLSALETLGIAYQLDGQFGAAAATYREALALRVKRGERGKPASINAARGLGVALSGDGKYSEAIPLLREALTVQTAATGAQSREVGLSLNQLAEALTGAAQHKEARDMFARALAIVTAVSGPSSIDAAAALGNLASAEGNLGNNAESVRLNRELLALRRKLLGPRDKMVGVTLNNLGFALSAAGDPAGAEAALRESLPIAREAYGAESYQVATTINNIASVVQSRGKLVEAERLSREAQAILTKTRGPDHPDTLRTQNNLGTIMQDQGKFVAAEAMFRKVYDIQSKKLGANHAETLKTLSNIATSLEAQGEVSEAEALNRKALTAAATNGQNEQYATILSNLATKIGNQGRFDEALGLHRQALTLREKLLGTAHPDVGLSYSNIGYILSQKRDYQAADEPLRKALAIGRKLGDKSLNFSSWLSNLGANYDELKRFSEAEAMLRESLAIRRAALPPTHPLIATSLNNLGFNAGAQGQRDKATALYREALEIMRKTSTKSDPDLLVPLSNLSVQLSANRSNMPEALSLAREGAAIVRERRLQLAAGDFGDSIAGAAARAKGDVVLGADPFVTAFIAQVEANWAAAGFDPGKAASFRKEAFVAAQEIDVPQAAQALARTAARAATSSPALSKLVARQQELTREINAADDQYLALAAAGDAAGAQAIERELRTRAAELSGVDAELVRSFPEYRALIAPTALSIDDVRAQLQADEAMMFIVPSNGHLYSFSISAAGEAWSRVDNGVTRFRPVVARLLCQIDPVTCAPGSEDTSPPSPAEAKGYVAFDRAAAFGLYRDLIAPVEAPLKGRKRVYLSVIGGLGKIPLGLLPTEAPAAGSDDADPEVLQKTPWLSDRYAITLLPAVSSLRFASRTDSAASGQAFVGYGAPTLTGSQAPDRAMAANRGLPLYLRSGPDAIANPAIINKLSPLPGTRVELAAMAVALGVPQSAIRLADAATETRLKSDRELSGSRVIAFATHGLLPGELNGTNEPALVLTPPRTSTVLDDGLLSTSEIASLKLSADWVILSACNTAAGSGAENLSGLARAFLFAGARSLLATHWRVDDTATAQLTVETLKADKTKTRATALQTAMASIRTGKRADGTPVEGWKPEWSHPAYWAPFSAISNADR
jgi:CHAT domain-containing protein/tetratricopeptide (TPR) repeat protein